MQNYPIEKLYALFLASTGITTDTRNIQAGNIFFSLKGEKFNANEFAEDALAKGAAYVVVDEIFKAEWKEQYSMQLVLVNDVLQTLQRLASYHRVQFKFPVLAITGSNGKTTTKELIAAVLSKKFKTYATKGNLNNHIGIPLTLLAVKTDAEFAVIEMGANHQGEIASYCEYVQPDFGLITNVGNAHLEGFGGFEGVVKGKTELYLDLAKRGGKVFVNGANEILMEKISDCGLRIADLNTVISYGTGEGVFCRGEIGNSSEFLSVVVDDVEIKTNLTGNYNFENVMSAVCVGKYFGVGLPLIKEAIENYTPSNNRSQKIVSGTNTIILDAYNANPSSMMEALKSFESLLFVGDNTNMGVVIIGQMMELGEYSEDKHKKIAAHVSTVKWNSVTKVFVGKGFEFMRPMVGAPANHGILWFEKTEEVKQWFKQQTFENTLILIKGSRSNELEKILNP